MENLSNIVKLKTSDWSRMLKLAVQWIQADFKAGKMQDGKSGLKYYSDQYKRYKANGMKQLEYGRSIYNPETGQLMRGKKLKVKTETHKFGNVKVSSSKKLGAKRLWGFYGKVIESKQTAFVDMTLSGNLKKGLHVKATTEQGGTIGYEPEDAKKIEGNRRYGREVVGMNEENREKLKNEIIAIYQKNAQNILAKDITINITL